MCFIFLILCAHMPGLYKCGCLCQGIHVDGWEDNSLEQALSLSDYSVLMVFSGCLAFMTDTFTHWVIQLVTLEYLFASILSFNIQYESHSQNFWNIRSIWFASKHLFYLHIVLLLSSKLLHHRNKSRIITKPCSP